jgi:hypothetical protein
MSRITMMTNVTDSQLFSILERVREITNLDLQIDKDASGYTLCFKDPYLTDINSTHEIIASSENKVGMYQILKGIYGTIDAMNRSMMIHGK